MSGDAFRLSGLKAYTDLWDALRQHAPDPAGLRILDWGCGCGRITRYLAAAGVLELRGCDIDAEAIAWCRRNLEGTFSVNAPEPPLPYADGELDVVVASSVFTHLARGHQEMWLRELQRILAPGGLLLASVSGETAFLQETGASAMARTLWLASPPGGLLPKATATAPGADTRRPARSLARWHRPRRLLPAGLPDPAVHSRCVEHELRGAGLRRAWVPRSPGSRRHAFARSRGARLRRLAARWRRGNRAMGASQSSRDPAPRSRPRTVVGEVELGEPSEVGEHRIGGKRPTSVQIQLASSRL